MALRVKFALVLLFVCLVQLIGTQAGDVDMDLASDKMLVQAYEKLFRERTSPKSANVAAQIDLMRAFNKELERRETSGTKLPDEIPPKFHHFLHEHVVWYLDALDNIKPEDCTREKDNEVMEKVDLTYDGRFNFPRRNIQYLVGEIRKRRFQFCEQKLHQEVQQAIESVSEESKQFAREFYRFSYFGPEDGRSLPSKAQASQKLMAGALSHFLANSPVELWHPKKKPKKMLKDIGKKVSVALDAMLLGLPQERPEYWLEYQRGGSINEMFESLRNENRGIGAPINDA